jgi:glucosamine--fructose-6-phosphate aminotransferase (isomerizing)
VENVLADADARIDLSGLEGIVTVGEGFAESVAEEGAIKIRETMQKLVTAMEASELLHGSINCLGRGHGLLAIAADALGAHLADKTLVEARARGVSTMFIGPDVQVAADQRVVLPEVPAEWIPLLAILPIQRAACEASVAAGSDPDRPVGLRKITRVQASGTR